MNTRDFWHLVFVISLFLLGCNEVPEKQNSISNQRVSLITEDFELISSADDEALLILFPGGGNTSKETKAEFDIVEKAKAAKISLLLMNFNRHLWIDDTDCLGLNTIIDSVISKYELHTDRLFIGGMSIGGTVAMTLSDYMITKGTSHRPKGVFIVDSPIDLYKLYESAEKDIMRTDFSEERLQEPRFIINYFEDEFGGRDSLFENIQKSSLVTLQSNNFQNIESLKDLKVRFYTEPDTLWWLENRQTDFENTNAYVLEQSNFELKKMGWDNLELIQSENKGFRADGMRHPHSWSIVDPNDLIEWILK